MRNFYVNNTNVVLFERLHLTFRNAIANILKIVESFKTVFFKLLLCRNSFSIGVCFSKLN